MASKPNVNVSVTAENRDFKRKMAESGGILGRFGVSARTAGLAAGAAFGAAAVGIGAALKGVMDQSQEMTNAIVEGTGATGDALNDLKDSAEDVFASVPDSAAAVGNALADVNTFLGTTGDELEDQTELFLDFARLTGTDVTAAVGNLDAAFTQFGEDINVDEALGDFLRISQATGAPIDKLMGQMETFGPLFANAGFEMEETTAIFGQLERAGVDVTRVGPALNKFFRDAASAGEDPREALEEMVEAIGSAETSAEALTMATNAFGAEGAQRMTSAIRSGNFELSEFGDLLGEGTGMVDSQTAATETLSDKFNTLKNTLSVALMPAAEAVLTFMTDTLDAVIPVIQEVAKAFSEDGLTGVLDLLSEKFAWFETGREIVEDAFDAIMVVVGAVQEAWEIWGDEIIAVTTATFDFVWEKVQNAIEFFEGLIDFVAGVFTGDWGRAWDGIKAMFSAFVDELINTVTYAKDLVVETFQAAWDLVALLWDWSFLGEAITSVVESVMGAAQSVGSAIKDGIIDGFSSAAGFAGDLVSGLWGGFRDIFNTQVVDKINNAIPNSLGLGPFSVNLPDNPIPRLAAGGIVTAPTLALIGEGGPEAVVPLSGPSIAPLGDGGVPYQVVLDGQVLAEGIARANRRSGGVLL